MDDPKWSWNSGPSFAGESPYTLSYIRSYCSITCDRSNSTRYYVWGARGGRVRKGRDVLKHTRHIETRETFRKFLSWAEPEPKTAVFRYCYGKINCKPILPMKSVCSEGVPFGGSPDINNPKRGNPKPETIIVGFGTDNRSHFMTHDPRDPWPMTYDYIHQTSHCQCGVCVP